MPRPRRLDNKTVRRSQEVTRWVYNRYINDSFADFFCPVDDDTPREDSTSFEDIKPEPEPSPKPAASQQSEGGGLFGGFKLPEMDADTIIMLLLVCFLVFEEDDSLSDTLLIIGALLLLGF